MSIISNRYLGIKVIFLTLGLLACPPSFGQFKKYQSKTQFKEEKNSPPPKQLAPPAIKSKPDSFGRTKGPNLKIKKDKNYVNLNFETAFGPEVVTSFNFNNISLTDLTKQMQKLTGLNLLLDKELKGTITITTASPITVGDAWKAYLSALEINGYSLVKTGAFFKIVSTRDVRYTTTKIYTGNFIPETDNYVMKIFPLKNVSSSEVKRSFTSFLTRYGRMIDIRQTNTILLQDTGTSVMRFSQVLKSIDVPGHERRSANYFC